MMGKSNQYPLRAKQLEAAVGSLIATGRHHDGKRAATPKPSYFANFRIKGRHGVPANGAILILDRFTVLDIECQLHGEKFTARPRGLLNTSAGYRATTCRQCERTARIGRDFTTLGEAAKMMSDKDAFDWTLDNDQLPTDKRDSQRSVGTKEYLPLKCKRNKWGTQEPCNATKTHTWGNIQHALLRDPDHIHCGGECDSARKGKALRTRVEEFEKKLREARGGVWKLSNRDKYRKMSEPQWFTHSCGNEVFRLPLQVLTFCNDSSMPLNTDADCPYCQQSSPLGCLDKSIPHYVKWVAAVTGRKIKFKGKSFPVSSDEALELECVCGKLYEADQWALQKNEHFGCSACEKAAQTKPRAWALDDARVIATRRGMTLISDPGSYIVDTMILDAEGRPAPHKTLLELVRALPATACGFGKVTPEQPEIWETFSNGKPYSRGEIDLISKNQSTMSYVQLAAILGRTDGSVKQQFRRLGIRNDQREEYKRTFDVWDNAFSVNTPQSCYWAGFLAADGTVDSRGDVSLELKALDEDVLQCLARYLKFTGSLNYRTVGTVGGRGIYAQLRFRSRQIREDLFLNFGIAAKKSLTLPPPALKDPMLCRAYMVGLMEGDGHLMRHRRGGLLLNFISAAPELFQWFVDRVEEILGKSVSRRNTAGKSKRTSSMTVWHGDAERLRASLLEAFPGKMARKWDV